MAVSLDIHVGRLAELTGGTISGTLSFSGWNVVSSGLNSSTWLLGGLVMWRLGSFIITELY